MMNTTIKMSSKGQVAIPAAIRVKLGLDSGSELIAILNENNEIVLQKVPSRDEWSSLMSKIPHERIAFDENGHYDSKAHPSFDEWVRKG